ncbi:MAG: paraquat-inducible protein A [Chromatiales bacterium]|nr:paraquat-inducible protein A [Chromatiales bacterium]
MIAEPALSGPSRVNTLLWFVAAGLLAAGYLLPLARVSQLLVFNDDVSMFSAIADLWIGGEQMLSVAIALFSVALPVFKLAALGGAMVSAPQSSLRRASALAERIGRWSMLDVFVVAVILVSAKTGVLASVEPRPGLYAFGAAVLVMLLLGTRVHRK